MPKRSNPIYLDSAASTRVAPEVCAAMIGQLDEASPFANPSSAQHEPGRHAAARSVGADRTLRDPIGTCVRCLSTGSLLAGTAPRVGNP
ncbi:hypothetical protein ABC977_15415 [Thioalkalicoccus limnaeus]|uniref:Cysteine desulfurase n=1 Tax=Thioalkalicoccus limnaeus TaxID=120681 RepID=A0ABV4BJW9_9GAMM